MGGEIDKETLYTNEKGDELKNKIVAVVTVVALSVTGCLYRAMGVWEEKGAPLRRA